MFQGGFKCRQENKIQTHSEAKLPCGWHSPHSVYATMVIMVVLLPSRLEAERDVLPNVDTIGGPCSRLYQDANFLPESNILYQGSSRT